jgi:hypothetical protein
VHNEAPLTETQKEIAIGSEKQSLGTTEKKYNSTTESSGSIGGSYKQFGNKD